MEVEEEEKGKALRVDSVLEKEDRGVDAMTGLGKATVENAVTNEALRKRRAKKANAIMTCVEQSRLNTQEEKEVQTNDKEKQGKRERGRDWSEQNIPQLSNKTLFFFFFFFQDSL